MIKLVCLVFGVLLALPSADAVPVHNASMTAYLSAFYTEQSVTVSGVPVLAAYLNLTTDGGVPTRVDFWTTCEMIELIEDGWDRAGDDEGARQQLQVQIGRLLDGLNAIVSGTPDWTSWNTFNDDVTWGVLALTRGYMITKNKLYLEQAQQMFDNVWARGWDPVDGGYYWDTSNQTKNACVNGPAAIAGFLLAQVSGGNSSVYQKRGEAAYLWLRDNLFNAATGQVADHLDASTGELNWGAYTYNQGTFMGAATMYALFAGNASEQLGLAQRAADWTRSNLTGQHVPGILNDEYAGGANPGQGDGVGFKGIFARWCNFYLQQGSPGARQTDLWLAYNAEAAWHWRNSEKLTWAQWWRETPSPPASVTSWECSSAAAILQANFGSALLPSLVSSSSLLSS